MMIKIKGTKVKVTKDDIDSIMDSALDGGINYWCNKVNVIGKSLGDYASEQISRGGCLKLHGREDNAWYELSSDNFKEGLSKYLNDCDSNVIVVDENSGLKLDSSNIDSMCADSIIQYALFGERVYS